MSNRLETSKKRWVSTSPWRGYEEPIYAVAGANDTGMSSDSPCPSDTCNEELNSIVRLLRESGIRSRKINCRSSNVFCIHRYVVPYEVEDVDRGREIVKEFISNTPTDLLYLVDGN